jgi:hypothetical protein
MSLIRFGHEKREGIFHPCFYQCQSVAKIEYLFFSVPAILNSVGLFFKRMGKKFRVFSCSPVGESPPEAGDISWESFLNIYISIVSICLRSYFNSRNFLVAENPLLCM